MKAKFVVGFVVIGAAIIWLAATGFEGAKSYYKTVDEMYAMGDEAHKYRLKVAGEVVEGTIHKTAGQVDFVMWQKGQTLKVSYTGSNPVPDTFVDHAQVVVEGRLRNDGCFQADGLQAKCASKYQAANTTQAAAPSQPQTR